jgi:ribosome recycling factor
MPIEFTIVENDTKSFEKAMDAEMTKTVKHFERELVGIRTGRAHSSMVEDIKIACYAQIMPLKNLAAIAAPDARLITIQPWDISTIGDIEKGLIASDIGLTPVNDGTMIRLQLPEMSTSRREDLIKVLGKKLEESRVTIRNVRKDFHNIMRDAKKNKTISEDFEHRLEDTLKKMTDKFIGLIEQMSSKKEQEIRLF